MENYTSSIELTIFLQEAIFDENVDVVGELKSSLDSSIKFLTVKVLGDIVIVKISWLSNRTTKTIVNVLCIKEK